MREVISRAAARACYLLALLLIIVLIRTIFANAFGFVGDSWLGHGTAEQEGGTSAAFQIKGDATAPISPGVSVPIALRFNNPHQQSMVVSHVHVTIRRPGPPLLPRGLRRAPDQVDGPHHGPADEHRRA
jgi:hypothetical protein